MSKLKQAMQAARPKSIGDDAESFITGAGKPREEESRAIDPEPQEPVELQLVKIPQLQSYSQANEQSYLWRHSTAIKNEIDFVLENSNAKSQRELFDALIVPQIRMLAAKIRGE